MLVKVEDTYGKIVAYCEYQIVDKDGKQDKNGLYTWINDVWVHYSLRPQIFKRLMRNMVSSELKKFPQVKWLYFKRDKHKGRIKMYDIRRMT